MTYTTQCPSCQTRFKVSDSQLAAANGLVRCGRCAHVFDAKGHLVPQEPPARPAAPVRPSVLPEELRDPMDDFELEVPDFDPLREEMLQDHFNAPPPPRPAVHPEPQAREAARPRPPVEDAPSRDDVEAFQRALNEAMKPDLNVPARPYPVDEAEHPLGDPFRDVDEDDGRLPAVLDTRRAPPKPATPEPAPAESEPPVFTGEMAEAPRPFPDEPPARGHGTAILWTLASLLGVILLALQLTYLNRTRIAAEVPEVRPLLERSCKVLGCTVPLATDQEFIRTEWSELSFVPEHPNLIQLSATLKNHAPYPQALPMLEVTLKDSEDQVLIRKVFTPREYLKPGDFALGRFNGSSELRVTMRYDVGKVQAQGYSLYWFYP